MAGGEDRTAYLRAVEMLRPSGTPLESAVMQFVETRKLLDGASMLEAAKFYIRHYPRHLPTRTVSERWKEKRKRSASLAFPDLCQETGLNRT